MRKANMSREINCNVCNLQYMYLIIEARSQELKSIYVFGRCNASLSKLSLNDSSFSYQKTIGQLQITTIKYVRVFPRGLT
jgi:hypothetical protein